MHRNTLNNIIIMKHSINDIIVMKHEQKYTNNIIIMKHAQKYTKQDNNNATCIGIH